MNTSPVELANKTYPLDFVGFETDKVPVFLPSIEVVEAKGGSSGAFQTTDPLEVLESGNYSRVPWMLGVSSSEGFYITQQILADASMLSRLNAEWAVVAPKLLYLDQDQQQKQTEAVRNFYFRHNMDIGAGSADNVTNLFSDRLFLLCTQQTAQLHSSHFGPTYLYWFNRQEGAFPPNHGEELKYLFYGWKDQWKYLQLNDTPDQDEDFDAFSESMVKLWVSFVTDGKPTVLLDSNSEWPSLHQQPKSRGLGLSWYQMDNVPNYGPLPTNIQDRMQFWLNLTQNIIS